MMLPAGLLPDPDTTPFWGLFIVFFSIAALRTQITYWAARIATTQLLTRTAPSGRLMATMHAWLKGGSADRGVAALNRWGVVVVPLSFLMPGSKTIINAAAGVTRMPFVKYLPAMLVGCTLHATIYASVGWAAWTSAAAAAVGSPWAIAVLVVLFGAAIVVVIHIRRRKKVRLERTQTT